MHSYEKYYGNKLYFALYYKQLFFKKKLIYFDV